MSFSSSMRKFVVQKKAQHDAVARKVIFEAARMVLLQSPVDTGRFRANWQYGFGVQPTGELNSTDLSNGGQNTLDQIAAQITKGVGVHYLVNNLPYAEVIEYGLYPDPVKKGSYVKGEGYVQKSQGGFSRQAPAGVLRITYEQLAADLSRIADEVPLQ